VECRRPTQRGAEQRDSDRIGTSDRKRDRRT
jgi:hypothetical protein